MMKPRRKWDSVRAGGDPAGGKPDVLKQRGVARVRRALLWVLSLLLVLQAFPAPAEEVSGTRVMVVTDLHYMAPSLYEGSGLFLRSIAAADSKMSHDSPELLQALMEEARHQRPDVLLLTGDLTFYGEKLSHQELAAAMGQLWDEGIPVYVLPGNHDINSPYARYFDGEDWGYTENVTPAEFREIWARCLPPAEAVSTMSYTIRLNDRVWIAMADVCVYEQSFEVYGFYGEDQQNWLTPMLREAREAGVTVISVTHQSLIPHTDTRVNSYSIYNREYMLADLRAGGVTLNLSGHIHTQHTVSQDGLTDVATGALSVHPHSYGMVTVGADGVPVYRREQLCDEHLPEGFRAESEAFFSAGTVSRVDAELQTLGVPDAERAAMVAFYRRMHVALFSDSVDPTDPAWLEDPALPLWRTLAPDTDSGRRVRSVFGE